MADKKLTAESPAVIVCGSAAIAALPGFAFGRIFACNPAALFTALVLGAAFGGCICLWRSYIAPRLPKKAASPDEPEKAQDPSDKAAASKDGAAPAQKKAVSKQQKKS
ncbi:MAG: hypothetical protein IJ055_07905 [Oscillospiraceae bacterium]|nr:hypothetical protein [Oscillospiraceae bacterium]